MKDCKWVTHSNQIKDFPKTIQDIDVAMTIWGKNIAALKGKTTWSKTHPVVRDYVKVPKELLKLHKEVFLTTYIFLDIEGFQGYIPILSTTWFPHHDGKC
jgi:hypothetical protein